MNTFSNIFSLRACRHPCFMVNYCLRIIIFSLNLITLFPLLCTHSQIPPRPSSSHMKLKVLPPSLCFSFSYPHPSLCPSRSVWRRFRSQTPHELWPPCWDINRRNCGGTLRLPGEMLVGSCGERGRGSTVTRSCRTCTYSCTCTERRRRHNGGQQFFSIAS